jgi:dephospho-CoA kinase
MTCLHTDSTPRWCAMSANARPDGPDGRPPPSPNTAAPFHPRRPIVIGLIGGIAAGKSTVARLFAERGLVVIDADVHAKAVSEEPDVLAHIGEALGPDLVRSGRLDRAAVARLVFADPQKKKQLEDLVLPRIRARILAELGAARAAGRSVLLDAPLLLEGGLVECCDEVVFVAAADAVRQARAAARGWAPDELPRREANQLPLADKRARADHVVDNDGDVASTRAAVDALLADLEGAR